jgi:hypothetical protein
LWSLASKSGGSATRHKKPPSGGFLLALAFLLVLLSAFTSAFAFAFAFAFASNNRAPSTITSKLINVEIFA